MAYGGGGQLRRPAWTPPQYPPHPLYSVGSPQHVFPGVKNCLHDPKKNVRSAARHEHPTGLAVPAPMNSLSCSFPCLAVGPQQSAAGADPFCVAACPHEAAFRCDGATLDRNVAAKAGG